MNYQQLQNFALQCSLEHYLCNVDELLAGRISCDEILAMVGESDNTDVVIYEPYEYYESESLVESIMDMRGVYMFNFMHILGAVNGENWLANYKKAGAA